MKRLIDEPEDEVTRLLLQAGANHRPPRFGKLRLMAALGLGSAVSLSASKALAGLSTSGAKASLVLAVVGASAGAGYVLLAPPSEPPGPRLSAPAAAAAPAAPGLPATRPLAAEEKVAAAAVDAEAPPVHARERGVRPPRRASVRKRLALEKSARPDDGVHAESPPAAPTGSSRSLRDETLWLDRLRVAAEQNDLAEFEDLLRGYEQRFPEGQLGLEARRLRDLISVR